MSIEHIMAGSVLLSALAIIGAMAKDPSCKLPEDTPYCQYVCVGKKAVCEFHYPRGLTDAEKTEIAQQNHRPRCAANPARCSKAQGTAQDRDEQRGH